MEQSKRDSITRMQLRTSRVLQNCPLFQSQSINTTVIGRECVLDSRRADWKAFSRMKYWNCCCSTLCRVDTNPIAHDLIDTFHSLSGVLDADIRI